MKAWPKWILTAVISGAVLHVAAVWATPRLLMGTVIDRSGERYGHNSFFYTPRATADRREVVRPSPDLNYSGCVLDVSEGPVSIATPVSEPYTSVSIFADNTDNLFAKNDRDARDGWIRVLVAGPDTPVEAPDTEVVWLPSNRGLALVRRVITSDSHNRQLNQLRQQSQCREVQP